MPELHRVLIAIPQPNEQGAIVERLEAIDSLIRRECDGDNKLQTLKSGLMTDLLTGRVPVRADLLGKTA